MRALAFLACLGMASAAIAQESSVETGTGATLRVLEKVNGQIEDYDLAVGNALEGPRLTITLQACRYPSGDPEGDAYAYVIVQEKGTPEPIFSGWMIGSSPALNAMEHPRYDVWVLRCKTD